MNQSPDQIAAYTIAVIVALGKVVGPLIGLIWLAINQWQTNALKSQMAAQAAVTDKRLDDHSATLKTVLLNTVPPGAVPATVTTPDPVPAQEPAPITPTVEVHVDAPIPATPVAAPVNPS